MFGPELTNGSERHEYLLSKKLAQLGVGVDVLTTRTRNSYQTSALSSAWPSDYSEGVEVVDGMRVERFPATFLPVAANWVLAIVVDAQEMEIRGTALWADVQGITQPG
jgi:hypothetical protein